MSDDIEKKSTCDTYLPLTLAMVGGVTGAVEGFLAGGVVGAIPAALLQTIGGGTLGKWVCDASRAPAVQVPAPTP